MKYELIIRSLAEYDIVDALDWYFKIDTALAQKLLAALDVTFAQIQENPEHYQLRHNTIRCIRVEKFPLSIHFSIKVQYIFVHAILHTNRNPNSWKDH